MSSSQPNSDFWRPARATFLDVLLPLVFMLPFKEDLGGGGDGKKIQEKAHAARALHHIIGDKVKFRLLRWWEKILLQYSGKRVLLSYNKCFSYKIAAWTKGWNLPTRKWKDSGGRDILCAKVGGRGGAPPPLYLRNVLRSTPWIWNGQQSGTGGIFIVQSLPDENTFS